jgi:hypothetical protein
MPISAGAGMLLSPIAGALAGSVLGGGGAKAAIPGDLRGQRQNNIDLLGHLLGFGSGGGQLTGFKGLKPQFSKGRTGGPSFGGDPTNRLESFFGNLTSPLQRQALQGMSQYLNQPAPETRAFDQSLPALQQILNGKPGQGIIDALQPSFDRNLASANQVGGRFSSGNAIMRSRAVDDFNLLGAQAAQQGINQQMQAAQVLGMLGQSAGQGPFDRLMGAMSAGDLEPSRRIGLLQQLLGTSQQATLGQPTTVTPGGTQQGMQAGFGIAQLIPFLAQMQGMGNIFGGGGIPQGQPFPGFDPRQMPVLR